MKISAKIKTKSKIEKVEKNGDGIFLVYVKEVPEKGKANSAIIKLLAGYFKTTRANVKIVGGLTSKKKIIEIEE